MKKHGYTENKNGAKMQPCRCYRKHNTKIYNFCYIHFLYHFYYYFSEPECSEIQLFSFFVLYLFTTPVMNEQARWKGGEKGQGIFDKDEGGDRGEEALMQLLERVLRI